ENIYRTMNVFRPFYAAQSGLPLAKPRFTLVENQLVLLKNPLPSPESYENLLAHPESTLRLLGEQDWFYQHRYRAEKIDLFPSIKLIKMAWYKLEDRRAFAFRPESEAFRLVVSLLAAFYEDVRSDDSRPVIVLFPSREDLAAIRQNTAPAYTKLVEALQQDHIKVVDLADAF